MRCNNCGREVVSTGGCGCEWNQIIIAGNESMPNVYGLNIPDGASSSWDNPDPILIAPGITHCRDGSIELRDARLQLVFTLPIDGGIILSDEFLTALKAQLSEHEIEKDTTNEL